MTVVAKLAQPLLALLLLLPSVLSFVRSSAEGGTLRRGAGYLELGGRSGEGDSELGGVADSAALAQAVGELREGLLKDRVFTDRVLARLRASRSSALNDEAADDVGDAALASISAGYGTMEELRSVMASHDNPFIRTGEQPYKGHSDNGEYGFRGADSQEHAVVLAATLCAAGMCTLIFLYQLCCHVLSFHWPSLQKFYIRIIFVTPMYTWLAWLTIYVTEYHPFYDLAKSCYEAYVIFCFWHVLLVYVGGYDHARRQLEELPAHEQDSGFRLCPGR